MKRTTGRSEAVRKTSRSVANQRRAATTQPSSSNPQTNANTIDQGKAMNDEEIVMSAEDNGDAWAHQLELEREQQEVAEATAGKWQDNYFVQLAKIDVSEHVEKKGGFSYLSWAWAVDRLRRVHPDATWEVKRFNGAPYLKTDCGYFVEVAVTVAGVTLSQIHPVLDARNRPIAEPNAFDINTSIQRCLVKAIALHGLGLYVYAGEDLPEGVEPVTISKEQQANLQALIDEVGADMTKFLDYFKIEKLADLPTAEYQRAINALEKKRKAA
jgi:hypothetical protein